MDVRTKWIAVDDPTTLKEGEHIRVVCGVLVVEGITGSLKVLNDSGCWRFDIEELDDYFYVSTDTSSVFVADKPFAVMDRMLQPGEIVEDQAGQTYMLNPLNPTKVISYLSGLTPLEGFIHIAVRPVR